MDCKEVDAALFLFFDNELEEALLTPFKDHVNLCGHCSRQLDYTRKLLLIVREKTVRCAAPEGLRYRILISLRQVASGPH